VSRVLRVVVVSKRATSALRDGETQPCAREARAARVPYTQTVHLIDPIIQSAPACSCADGVTGPFETYQNKNEKRKYNSIKLDSRKFLAELHDKSLLYTNEVKLHSEDYIAAGRVDCGGYYRRIVVSSIIAIRYMH
jgi:hypothetical protein